jgi:hypothetical protein
METLTLAIKYTMQVEGALLNVNASGRDDSVQEVKDYGMAIIEKAVAHGITRILCDETDLEYTLSALSTFDAATFIAEVAPKVARVAIVINPKNVEAARFWENVAVNRGLQVRLSTDRERALKWLTENLPDT